MVVEQLSLAKHKRSRCFHMVVVPRIFTAYWRKHLSRATDTYFKIDASPVWSLKDQFEPVLIFLSLPLVTHSPRFEMRTKLLEDLERLLQGPRVSEVAEPWFRARMRELLSQAWELC